MFPRILNLRILNCLFVTVFFVIFLKEKKDIFLWHYHLQVEPNPRKTGLTHDIFFWINARPLGLSRSLRLNENQGWIFEAATSNFCNHSRNFGSSPRNGKVDLWTTNGSIVLIYLTLLNFLLHYLQEYSKIWNIEKSNKSELWNRLSYRGLPYHFEVRS